MDTTPMTEFFRSIYAQQIVKTYTAERYDQFSTARIDQLIKTHLDASTKLTDKELAAFLDTEKGLTLDIQALPTGRFTHESVAAEDLVTTLWVSDLPHGITHGTFADVRRYAADRRNDEKSPIFFQKISRLADMPFVLMLPILVVSPSRYQRSERGIHSIDSSSPDTAPFCGVDPPVEGYAYIEDGNHRSTARILRDKTESLEVIRYSCEDRNG